MKIEKSKLAKKIGQMKGIINKNSDNGALQGILVKDGYLIASNTELTVKAKLEGMEGESFIIPMKSFELIDNLPDGDIQIQCEKNVITIQIGKINNHFKTYPVEQFAYDMNSFSEDSSASVMADRLKRAAQHVIYAVPDGAANKTMEGMFFKCAEGKLNMVGLDGHRVAWDCLLLSGEFSFIVPKEVVEKIIQFDIKGEIRIAYSRNAALFQTDDYEIYTRLIEGEYFQYEKMFSYGDINTVVDRRLLMEAINRARLCGSKEDRMPIVMEIDGKSIRIMYKNSVADYHEEVPLQEEAGTKLKIGFNPKLLLDSLKAFDCDNIAINFSGKRMPAIINAEDSDMTALILPVNLKED